MFTGIIEATGTISSIQRKGGDYQIAVNSGDLDLSDVALGDSIATNGVCLTVVSLNSNGYVADVSNETIKNTGFAKYQVGQKVNLEKAMLPTTRFGGHMVSGHVDCVTEVASIIDNGRAKDIWLYLPKDHAKYLVKKGSVTIDGISLTVNDVNETQFKLTIVPHTSSNTTLDYLYVGSSVNLEVDLVARYVERLIMNKEQGVTMELLSRTGYLK
ncbi:MAG: riboflavin synthase [Gammaproteobacteria bacterium]|nr:riboflavin synthase [Gammaproteobacteria bacterium]